MSEETQPEKKSPILFRNYLSFVGTVIVTAAVVSILLLFLIELTQTTHNPYLGIVTYIILPAFLAFGLIVILIGMLIETPPPAFTIVGNCAISTDRSKRAEATSPRYYDARPLFYFRLRDCFWKLPHG